MDIRCLSVLIALAFLSACISSTPPRSPEDYTVDRGDLKRLAIQTIIDYAAANDLDHRDNVVTSIEAIDPTKGDKEAYFVGAWCALGEYQRCSPYLESKSGVTCTEKFANDIVWLGKYSDGSLYSELVRDTQNATYVDLYENPDLPWPTTQDLVDYYRSWCTRR